MRRMEPECVKKLVEKQGGPYEFTVDSMPTKFIEPIVMQGIKVDRIERGLVLCSFVVPPRLLVGLLLCCPRFQFFMFVIGNIHLFLCCGFRTLATRCTAALVDIVGSAAILTMGVPTTGVSVDINISYLDGAFVGVICLFH